MMSRQSVFDMSYGNPSASIVLIQMVDDHDLEGMESEAAEIKKRTDADFCLLAIKVQNWNRDLSPWPTPAVFGKEGFGNGAADMLNEGFLKVFSNLDKYENSGSFEAWLKRVVCNAALDYRRRYDKNVEFVDIDEIQEVHLSDYNVNDAISKISSNEIVRLIQQLPPVTRMVFNMFLFEGFSHREIAQQLNITENTSAWHVNNARNRLKEELKQFDNE